MKFWMMTLTLLVFNVTIFGVESINDQIEAIKNAPPTERIELMNRLKIQIAAMNEEDRLNALNTLQQNRCATGNRLQLKRHHNGGLRQRLRRHNR